MRILNFPQNFICDSVAKNLKIFSYVARQFVYNINE